MPLEHVDFHIIGYWMSSIWSLWHIPLEETCGRHIGDKQVSSREKVVGEFGPHGFEPYLSQTNDFKNNTHHSLVRCLALLAD